MWGAHLLQGSVATAVQQLLEGTNATKPGFLDLRLHKQRKRASGGTFSRQWFVRESDWLAGTTADAQAVPAFFDEPQQVLASLLVIIEAVLERIIAVAYPEH